MKTVPERMSEFHYRPSDREDAIKCMDIVNQMMDALYEAEKDLVGYQVNARIAAKHDSKWRGVSDIIQPTIDEIRRVRNIDMEEK